MSSTAALDGFSTRAIHVGSRPDPVTGAVIPPLSLSTTFAQSSPGVHLGFDYSRSGNPTRNGLEDVLTSLERGAGTTVAFASGSAGTAAIAQWCCLPENEGGPVPDEDVENGVKGEILCINDVYGGTYRYLTRVAAPTTSVKVTFLDMSNVTGATLRSHINRSTRLIWVESPTNPLLILPPIRIISDTLRQLSASPCSPRHSNGLPRRPLLLVDNTFLSPYWSNPIADAGADLVLHSLSKYVNGHSDVIMGAVCIGKGLEQTVGKGLRFLQNSSGGIPSPFDIYLAHRGTKTLRLRALQHGLNALQVAKHLSSHSKVKEVSYPGLSSSKFYDRAKESLAVGAKQDLKRLGWNFSKRAEPDVKGYDAKGISSTEFEAKGSDASSRSAKISAKEEEEGGIPFSGMISIRLASEDEGTMTRFLQSVRLFALAESLGGVESLIECPALMTHASIPAVEREKIGITTSLVRLSVGIEDVEDLISDLDQAIDRAFNGEKITSTSVALGGY